MSEFKLSEEDVQRIAKAVERRLKRWRCGTCGADEDSETICGDCLPYWNAIKRDLSLCHVD